LKSKVYVPEKKAHQVYRELYSIYKTLHDTLGTKQGEGNGYSVMKCLIEIRNRFR